MENILSNKENFVKNLKASKISHIDSLVSVNGDKAVDALWVDFNLIMSKTPQYITELLCIMYSKLNALMKKMKDDKIDDPIISKLFPKGNPLSRTTHIYDFDGEDKTVKCHFSFIDYKRVDSVSYKFSNKILGYDLFVYIPKWMETIDKIKVVDYLQDWTKSAKKEEEVKKEEPNKEAEIKTPPIEIEKKELSNEGDK